MSRDKTVVRRGWRARDRQTDRQKEKERKKRAWKVGKALSHYY